MLKTIIKQEMKTLKIVHIATDGACIQPRGFRKGDSAARPGAWGFVVKLPNTSILAPLISHVMAVPDGTIGEMEMRAVHDALVWIHRARANGDINPEDVVLIQSDSQFVVNGVNDWMHKWKSNNWHKSGGLAHAGLWAKIYDLFIAARAFTTIEHVKAHQNVGNLNDTIDGLVNKAAAWQKSTPLPGLKNYPGQKTLVTQPISAPISGPAPMAAPAQSSMAFNQTSQRPTTPTSRR